VARVRITQSGLLDTPPIIFESSLLLGTLGDLDVEDFVRRTPVLRTVAFAEEQQALREEQKQHNRTKLPFLTDLNDFSVVKGWACRGNEVQQGSDWQHWNT
jgi:hypothetical protein